MMKNVILGLLLIFVASFANATGPLCPQCRTEVLAGDRFCPKCGMNLERIVAPKQHQVESPTYEHVYSVQQSGSSTKLPFYQGMGRGLLTVCGAPLECVRLVSVSFVEVVEWDRRTANNHNFNNINAGDLGVLGAAIAGGCLAGITTFGVVAGSISAVGDVCVGTLDFLTFGNVGDAVWEDPKKDPCSWNRRWRKGEVGGPIF